MAGRVQLETTGPQDRFFTVEPQFTYFTKRFSRHTNFAKTFTKHDFEGVPEFGTTLRSRIPSNIGDLLKTISFEIELDAIPNASSSGIGYVESIAHAMIEYVDLIVGGHVIQRIPSDYLQIYSEHNYTQTNQTALSKLIGKYPNRQSSIRVSNPAIIGYLGTATTSEKYFVDVPFYFYRHPELAIPLCAIDRQEIEIEVKFRNIEDVVVDNTIISVNNVTSYASHTAAGIGYAVDNYLQVGVDIDGEAIGDESGFSIDMSRDGTIMAIGAPNNDATPNDGGHVRVYQLVNQTWTQMGADIDGTVAQDFFGQSVSLSANGMILAVGAPDHNYNAISNNGQVKIFRWNGTTWGSGETINPTIHQTTQNLNFGGALQLSDDGNTIVIGGRGYATSQGVFYVYTYEEGAWNHKHTEFGQATGDALGYSVSISGDGLRVAGGANNPDGTSYVRTLYYNSTFDQWLALGNYINSENPGDEFGFSIHYSGDGQRLAIGGPKNNGIGHVRVFEYSGSDWVQVGQDIDGEAVGDQSGISVALSHDGNTLVIGANLNDGTGVDAGHVRVYRYGLGGWMQVGADLDAEALGDELGWSVAISGDGSRIAAGAKSNDGTGTSAGHVRVYDHLKRSYLENRIKKFGMNLELVFLESAERLKIQHTRRDFVISQIQENTFKIPKGVRHNTVNLSFVNPVKELFFVIQRENKRQFNDFVSPFDYDNIYVAVDNRLYFYENLVSLELTLDDERVISGETGKFMFLKALQPGIHHSKTPLIRRFYSYNFGFEPEKSYPTGQKNFSLVKNQILRVHLTPNDTHDRDLRVYALSYNVLRVMDGIAQTIFEDK